MRYLLVLFALLGFLASDAYAQSTDASEMPPLTIAVHGGGAVLNPITDTSGDRAGVLGGSIALWPAEFAGVRGSFLRTRSPLLPEPIADRLGSDRTGAHIWAIDLIARRPLDLGWRSSIAPFAFAGLGMKDLRFSDESRLDPAKDLLGQWGAGLEYRRGMLGISAEARRMYTAYHGLGVQATHRDWVYALGASLTLGEEPEPIPGIAAN